MSGSSIINTGSIGGGLGASAVYSTGGQAVIDNRGIISSSNATGIEFAGAFNNTVINSGAIIGGGGTAVQFGDGDDTLEIESGASFAGAVDGGTGHNTLILASGTLASPPVFSNFQDVEILSGVGGEFSRYAGADTITNAGPLTNTVYVATTATFTNNGNFSNRARSRTVASSWAGLASSPMAASPTAPR